MNILESYGISRQVTENAALYPDLKPARVIAQYKGLYKIAAEEYECFAQVSGKYRHVITDISLYPAVGDYVMISGAESESDQAVIHNILPRKSIFERTAVGVIGKSQVVAANIDIIFICMALNSNFNLSRLERYLSIAWGSGATPIILLTKSDLCGDLPARIREVEGVSAFSDIAVTSAFDDQACHKILNYVKAGVTASFIGSSGVGKSTVINKLMGKEVMTTYETGRLDKGRHTTTGREMLILPNGGIVIDTPGMREIGVESADISKSFSDIEALEENCKFRNCTHTTEPGCAVRKALEDGIIDRRRLDNYFKIKREVRYDGLSSREIESTKLNDMFKEFGGIKNMRKFIRMNDKRNRRK